MNIYHTPEKAVPLERSQSVTHKQTTPPTPTLGRTYSQLRCTEITSPYKYDKKHSPGTIGAIGWAVVHGNKISPDDKSNVVVKDLKAHCKDLKKDLSSMFSSSDKKDQSIVYRWKVNNKRYIGETANGKNRFSQYTTKLRKKLENPKPFYKDAIESAPKHGLTFGPIFRGVPTRYRTRLEDILIRHLKKKDPQNVYNERNGGGGGRERKSLQLDDLETIYNVACNVLEKKNSKKLEASFSKPIPFQVDKNGKVSFDRKIKLLQQKGVVYDYYDKKTGKHYVGKAKVYAKDRISTEVSGANTGKNVALWQKELKARPTDFSLRIIYKAPKKQKHIIEEIEHIYIRALDSCNNGYNSTSSSKRLFSKITDKDQWELQTKIREVLNKINPETKKILKKKNKPVLN